MTLNNKERIKNLGQQIEIRTNSGKIITGRIEAYNFDEELIALSNVTIKNEDSGKQISHVAAILDERDIRHWETIQKKPAKEVDQSEKSKSGRFPTDGNYKQGTDADKEKCLEKWGSEFDKDHDEDIIDEKASSIWSATEMFEANERLGVKSSFTTTEQYQRSKPVGDENARRKADKLAKEIESNVDSKRNAELENLDEETDIKEVGEVKEETKEIISWRARPSPSIPLNSSKPSNPVKPFNPVNSVKPMNSNKPMNSSKPMNSPKPNKHNKHPKSPKNPKPEHSYKPNSAPPPPVEPLNSEQPKNFSFSTNAHEFVPKTSDFVEIDHSFVPQQAPMIYNQEAMQAQMMHPAMQSYQQPPANMMYYPGVQPIVYPQMYPYQPFMYPPMNQYQPPHYVYPVVNGANGFIPIYEPFSNIQR